jgi:phosphate starvation-inducible PhoH-like protein
MSLLKTETRITVDDVQQITGVFGSGDRYLKTIDAAFEVTTVLRGDEIIITGKNPEQAENTIRDMIWLLEKGDELDEQRAEYIISLNKEGKSYRDSRLSKDILCFTHRGKPVKAKTVGQINYANDIRENDIVFGIGPAGTGKTYLAVAMAVNALKNKEVQKIILARPAVEAGENLGFLPGDLQEKVDPYLRPLYDALFDILGRDAAMRLKEKETIEVVPLAYMRGRTLDDAFIILDEAQNTTREQMKMFLTRLGFGSKAVVTGDMTQIDLPKKKMSGLRDALRVLKGVEGIKFSYFEETDVVRHPLVRRIIKAYEQADTTGREYEDNN